MPTWLAEPNQVRSLNLVREFRGRTAVDGRRAEAYPRLQTLPEGEGLAASVPHVGGKVRHGVPRRLGITLSSHWFRVAVCVFGLATAPLVVLPVVRSGGTEALDTTLVLM